MTILLGGAFLAWMILLSSSASPFWVLFGTHWQTAIYLMGWVLLAALFLIGMRRPYR